MHGYRSNDFQMIPMGPRNAVGVMWMGPNKPGIGIHGIELPRWRTSAGSVQPRLYPRGELGWSIRFLAMVSEGMKASSNDEID